MLRTVFQSLAGSGIGLYYSTIQNDSGNVVQCAKWNYGPSTSRFQNRHLINAFDRTSGGGRVIECHPAEAMRWNRLTWNSKLKSLMNYNPPGEKHHGRIVSYGGEDRLAIILQRYDVFLPQYQSFDPRTDDSVKTGFNRSLDTGPFPVQQQPWMSFYPRLEFVMTAYWKRETNDYDIYISRNQHILIGHFPSLTADEELLPLHYEGCMQRNSERVRANFSIVNYLPALLPIIDNVPFPQPAPPIEQNTRDLIEKSFGEKQARFTWSERWTKWFLFTSTCIRDSPPYKPVPSHAPIGTTHAPLIDILPTSASESVVALNHYTWNHSPDAIGLDVDWNMHVVRDRSFSEWKTALIDMIGYPNYGIVKIHHILLMKMEKLLANLMDSDDDWVSDSHKNWKWLNGEKDMLTFVWNSRQKAYRVYLYKAYVVIECKEGVLGSGNYRIPHRIVFVDKSINVIKDVGPLPNPYLIFVMEQMDEILLQWGLDTRDIL